ncbi:MAG: carbohydrate binding domain-containing protein, partial [Lachnospiraceae bacterium]|nr:carbohydrate binding domain-containing protein [Lachnospiraceae bacterium]
VNKPDGSSDWPERANNEAVPSGEWVWIEGDIPIYPDATSPMIYWEATDTYDFYIDDVVATIVEGAVAEAHYQDIVVNTPDLSNVESISLTFNDDNLFFGNRGDGTPAIVSGGHDDDFAMQVTGRSSNWHGAEVDLSSYNLAGRTINISYWVKVEEATEVNVTLQEDFSDGSSTAYNRVASSGDLTPGEWTQVSGTIEVGAATSKPVLYFESPSETASFTVDEVVISFAGEAAAGANEGNNEGGEAPATTGGGANEVADAPVEPGSIVYYNNFENELGNYLDGSNSYNYATNENVVGIAHNGNECVLVKSREYDNAGCGLRISAANGLSAEALKGHTVEFSVWVMYEDGAFSAAPDSINFTIWNRQKAIGTDDAGNTIHEIALEQVVNKGEWVQLVATLEIADGIDNGMLLIGTQGEESATGYLTSYYMDEMQLKVVE